MHRGLLLRRESRPELVEPAGPHDNLRTRAAHWTCHDEMPPVRRNVMRDNLVSLPKVALMDFVGTLDPGKRVELAAALRSALELD